MPIYPRDFFDASELAQTQGTAFVLMPFGEPYDEIYQEVIKEAAAEAKFQTRRADEIYGSTPIMEDILTGIEQAEVVLADLTGKNPNVLYELGVAHTRKSNEKVIILSQSPDDVPFDIRHYRVIKYAATITGAKKLRAELVAVLRKLRLKPFSWCGEQWRPLTPNWVARSDSVLTSIHSEASELAMVFCRTPITADHFTVRFHVTSQGSEVNVILFGDGENRMSGYHLWFWRGGAKLARLRDEQVLNKERRLATGSPVRIEITYAQGSISASLDGTPVLQFDDPQPLHGVAGSQYVGLNTWSSSPSDVDFRGFELISHGEH